MNPPLLNPKKQITATPAALTKIVQKAARKPSINAILVSLEPECSVTDAAMAAVTARPTEFPNCDTSLKTPPARDCVSTGNASDMMRFDTVKSTASSAPRHQIIYRNNKRNADRNLPSGLTGDRNNAQNGEYQ